MTGARSAPRVSATMEATLPGRGQDMREILEWGSRIVSVLPESDDLRRSPWRGDPNPAKGHCYVASEALWWMVGDLRRHLVPTTVRHEGAVHWWLSAGDRPIDLTASQFSSPVPYELGRGRGFLTGASSARARTMMSRAFRRAARADIEMLEACVGRGVEVEIDGDRYHFGDLFLRMNVKAGKYGIVLRTGMGARDLLHRLSRHVRQVRQDLLEEVLQD